jgi:hypothetical protein
MTIEMVPMVFGLHLRPAPIMPIGRWYLTILHKALEF